MGDNLRRNFPFPAPSLDPEACATELNRTNSDFSDSSVTIDCFGDPTENVKPGQTMVWTNEKHNAYLDFLEASFVKQLHRSMSLHDRLPQEETWEQCPTSQLPAKGHHSRQFLVQQDGCCRKIKHERNDPLLDSTADSSDILGSPSLHHFKSAGKSSFATFPVPREIVVPNDGIYLRSDTNFSCKSARISGQHPRFDSCNHSLGGCTTEVSDQNFVDEDGGEKTSCVSGPKRLKMMAMVDASRDSQIVPLGKLHSEDDSIISNTSAKRMKKKLLSDYPESFAIEKSDIHYFLRESFATLNQYHCTYSPKDMRQIQKGSTRVLFEEC